MNPWLKVSATGDHRLPIIAHFSYLFIHILNPFLDRKLTRYIAQVIPYEILHILIGERFLWAR